MSSTPLGVLWQEAVTAWSLPGRTIYLLPKSSTKQESINVFSDNIDRPIFAIEITANFPAKLPVGLSEISLKIPGYNWENPTVSDNHSANQFLRQKLDKIITPFSVEIFPSFGFDFKGYREDGFVLFYHSDKHTDYEQFKNEILEIAKYYGQGGIYEYDLKNDIYERRVITVENNSNEYDGASLVVPMGESEFKKVVERDDYEKAL